MEDIDNEIYTEWAEQVIWDDKYWQSKKNTKSTIKLPECEDLDNIPY